MTILPEPLTPPDCDLRGYDFMPLFGHRLFRSELYEQTNGEQFKVAVKLWWEAWNQCPAGSLPDDDHKLCRLADMGRDMKGWRRMRESVLRGFTLCSDGRLYHKLICEWAMEAYERRVRDRERKRRWRQNADGDGNGGGSHSLRPRDNGYERRGQDSPSQSSSAFRPRRVPDERRGEDRTGEDRRGEDLDSKNLNKEILRGEDSAKTAPSVPPVGPEAASAVVVALQKGLRMTAYPPRKAERSASEQMDALNGKPRPKPAYLTREQINALRRRVG